MSIEDDLFCAVGKMEFASLNPTWQAIPSNKSLNGFQNARHLESSLRRFARPALPRLAGLLQHWRQEFAGIAARRLDDIFRRTPGDDFAAVAASKGL
jgi:hypothetical protein